METKDEIIFSLQEISKIEREVFRFTSIDIRKILLKIDRMKGNNIEEIRLRVNNPLMIIDRHGDWFVNSDGKLSRNKENAYIVKQIDIVKTLELMSENSFYAYMNEIVNGFITLRGGHRVGISGRAIIDEGKVKNIKDISGLNIRISRQVIGCSNNIVKHIIKNSNEVYNTLIVSPPQCGKTTILRDLARVLSDGNSILGFKGIKVGIVDERSEIASCHRGMPQNNVGIRTDILDACPKDIGMPLMLRSMSPQVIITDEIGNRGDMEAVMNIINAGVRIITTAHGFNVSEMKSRKEVLGLIRNKVFERYIVLSNKKGPGTIEEILSKDDLEDIENAI